MNLHLRGTVLPFLPSAILWTLVSVNNLRVTQYCTNFPPLTETHKIQTNQIRKLCVRNNHLTNYTFFKDLDTALAWKETFFVSLHIQKKNWKYVLINPFLFTFLFSIRYSRKRYKTSNGEITCCLQNILAIYILSQCDDFLRQTRDDALACHWQRK